MAQCIVIVQFDLPKRTEEQAIKGGMASAPTYRNLATKGLIRKDYLNGDGRHRRCLSAGEPRGRRGMVQRRQDGRAHRTALSPAAADLVRHLCHRR